MKQLETMDAQNPVAPIKPGFRPKLRYQKQGKGSFELFNALIKPGQIISLYPEDVPVEYKDVLLCIDSPEMQEWAKQENEAALTKENVYALKENETAGWWDVVNVETEKSINEKRLRKQDAETLLATLNA